MAEWLKAAVLKTVERKFRGFESYSLRQELSGQNSVKIQSANVLLYNCFTVPCKLFNCTLFYGEMAE
jgi:hypothetical protein